MEDDEQAFDVQTHNNDKQTRSINIDQLGAALIGPSTIISGEPSSLATVDSGQRSLVEQRPLSAALPCNDLEREDEGGEEGEHHQRDDDSIEKLPPRERKANSRYKDPTATISHSTSNSMQKAGPPMPSQAATTNKRNYKIQQNRNYDEDEPKINKKKRGRPSKKTNEVNVDFSDSRDESDEDDDDDNLSSDDDVLVQKNKANKAKKRKK